MKCGIEETRRLPRIDEKQFKDKMETIALMENWVELVLKEQEF